MPPSVLKNTRAFTFDSLEINIGDAWRDPPSLRNLHGDPRYQALFIGTP